MKDKIPKQIKKIIMNPFTIKSLDALKLIIDPYPKLNLQCNYDEYWKVKKGKNFGILSAFQKRRLEFIQKEIKGNSKSIKDVGCGEGVILYHLAKAHKFSALYGYDISVDSLNFIKKYGILPYEINLSDLEALEKVKVTDYTIILEVLEHTSNPEEILLKLLDLTEETLVFSVPNTGYIGHRLRLLFGSFPLQWRFNPSEHLRFWTYRDMKWWLKGLQLEKESKIYLYEGIPFFNLLFPSLFCMGQLIVIKKRKKSNSSKNNKGKAKENKSAQ